MVNIEDLQNKLVVYFQDGTSDNFPAEYLGLSDEEYSMLFDSIWTPQFRFRLFISKENKPSLEKAFTSGYTIGGLLNTFTDSVVINVAAHLYSLNEDFENHSKMWHANHFIYLYNNYKDKEHDGDCTNKPYSCSRCFINKYIDMAKCIINTNALEWFTYDLTT